jgi:FKBP-type peptidyl-prolyl cis-trans isomerase
VHPVRPNPARPVNADLQPLGDVVRISMLLSLTLSLSLSMLPSCTGEEGEVETPVDAPVDAAADQPKPPEDVAAPPGDAKRLESGISYKVLTPGTGTEQPGPFSRVTASYTIWSTEGKLLDSNAAPGPRARLAGFGMQEVPVPFLREPLEQMVAGSKARFWIPAEVAYKDAEAEGEEKGAVTVDIELSNVVNPPAAPDDVGAIPADATKTPSGLAYKVLKAGTGDETPSRWARVTVSFTGWQTDGTVIDSTVARGRPTMIKLTDASMPGWTEAMGLLHRHEKIRVWIPEALAHAGKEGMPKGMLVYDIELLSFDNPVPPPDDVAAPPSDAKTTASGLAYKVLKPGTGSRQPSADSIVEVNYTGWTTDGNMFDSTTKRNKPMRFATTQVIPGWTEGLQLMRVGEQTRFWIPSELAYDEQPGKPQGMLVFDVELVSFEDGPKTPPDLNTPAADGRKSPGGVTVKTLKAGKGSETPVEGAKVEVEYTGWTANDGRMFDSTQVRGEPARFALGGAVPKGLIEGLQMMTKGERARIWVPEALATTGRPGGPQGMLVFELELVDFTNPPPPIPAPADVSAPPADATKTESGLAYKVLQEGEGEAHPEPTSRVKVHYTGWTAADGEMFDSSVQRGEPAAFALNGVIKGWTEGLQLMTAGDKYRFWIPGDLAYGDKPGRPQGMLVFDVELLEIMEGGGPGMRPMMRPHPPGGGAKAVPPK